MLSRAYYDDDEDDENGDEESYLASYSDLVTDLMAVFVLLLSFALITVSGTIVSAKAAAEAAQSQQILVPEDNLSELLRSIEAYIESEGLSDQLSVKRDGDHQILLRVSSSALFESGKSDISAATGELLNRISGILNQYENSIQMVRIEGHTDNRPIKTPQFDSNWELSTSRAVNILRWLQNDSLLGAKKFSAVGYGEFHPVGDNNTPDGRAANRRVDFIIEALIPRSFASSK